MKDSPDRLALANRDEDVFPAAVGDLHRNARLVHHPGRLELGDHAADGGLAGGAPGQLFDPGVDPAHLGDKGTGAVLFQGQAAGRWKG